MLLCDGLDPNRFEHLNVDLEAASDVADCQSKCLAYGNGCNNVAFKAGTGECYGLSAYTGNCEADADYKTYTAGVIDE